MSSKYSPKTMAAKLKENRGLIYLTARQMGCSPGTVYNHLKRYPSVKKAYEEARERTVDTAEVKFFQAIERGESWAISLALKTIGRRRGYVERKELTGKDGEKLVEQPKIQNTVLVIGGDKEAYRSALQSAVQGANKNGHSK